MELVRNIFAVNEHYSPDTPMYKAIMALLERLQPIVKRFAKGNEILSDLPGFVATLIYDESPDIEAVIPIAN